MGGKLFNQEGREIPRMEPMLYAYRTSTIIHQLGSLGRIPVSFGDKTSFGDIDVVGAITTHNFVSMLESCCQFKVVERKHHDPSTVSALVEDGAGLFQADYRQVPLEHLDIACAYFSNNDMGNLIGRIAHRIGLKFGFDGLVYVLNQGDRRLGEFTLTTNFQKALVHLGFETLPETFETREEAFEWILTSKFFEPSAYPLEHQSHRARVRDAKRPTYNAFLEFLQARGYDLTYHPSEKDAYQSYHEKAFPDLRPWINQKHQQVVDQMNFKVLFGGVPCSRLTGLKESRLGKFVTFVKDALEGQPVWTDMIRIEADHVINSLYSVWKRKHDQ